MRKVILQEFVSIDLLAAGPNANVDFIPAAMAGDESFGREQAAFIDTVDTMLLGSITYRLFVGYWPNVKQGKEKDFADKFNALRKIVFSRKLENAPWGSWPAATVSAESAADKVAKLKNERGKDIVVFGSISIAQALIYAGLIDEYRLVVCPLVLGSGRSLFADASGSFRLKLMSAKALDRGGVLLRYGRDTTKR